MPTVVDLTIPEDADPQVGVLLAVLEDVTREWSKNLGDVSDNAVVWQPFPGGHSIGALILHMADVEAHWIHQVGAGVARTPEELSALLSEETDQYGVRWPVPPSRPLSWYRARHSAVRARTREHVLALNNPEHLCVLRDHAFTLRWLLNHVISHEAYHGGQAVLLSLLRRERGEAHG